MTAESHGPISPREGAALWTVHRSLHLACALRCTVTPLTLSLRGPPGPALLGSWEPWAALPPPRWRVSVCGSGVSICLRVFPFHRFPFVLPLVFFFHS